MAKYRVKSNITGYINGQLWPEVGKEIEVDGDLSSMVDAGDLEPVKAAKKAAAKPDKAEKRPAAKANVETRKS